MVLDPFSSLQKHEHVFNYYISIYIIFITVKEAMTRHFDTIAIDFTAILKDYALSNGSLKFLFKYTHSLLFYYLCNCHLK